MYGPFHHQLNKGGLDDILTHGRLISTTARIVAGGGEAVRAHNGAFTGTPGGNTIIEFYTDTPPRSGTPPWLAEWPLPEGEYLGIKVVKVYHENGKIQSFT
jgi:hypothetical protein